MNGKVLYCQDEYKFDIYKIDTCREYLDLAMYDVIENHLNDLLEFARIILNLEV